MAHFIPKGMGRVGWHGLKLLGWCGLCQPHLMSPSFPFEHQPCWSHFGPKESLYTSRLILFTCGNLSDWVFPQPMTTCPYPPALYIHTHTHTHTDTHTHTPPFYSCLILPPPSLGFPDGSASKESTCNAGGTDSVPGAERSPGEGHGNPLQYSRLENSMIRGAWQESMGLQIVGYNWAHGTYTPLQEHQNRVVAKAFRSNPVSSPRIFHRCYHPINFLHVQLCMAWVIPSHPSH